jgi:hypothetical protein
MRSVPYNVVQNILLDIPKSSLVKEFSNDHESVFLIGEIVVVIPKKSIDILHFMDILQSQLDMHWAMIDYLLGQNGYHP